MYEEQWLGWVVVCFVTFVVRFFGLLALSEQDPTETT